TILTGALNILKMKMNNLLQAQGNCHHNIFYLQQQAKYTEDQINEEFKKLKLFLETEEAHMVTELEMEVQQKTARIKDKIEKIQEEINALSNLIRDINVELQSEDIKFVKNFDANMSKAQYKNQDPTPSREVISFVKYLGNLQFQVWSKMQSFIRY
ncbi:zinc-binding protein A33-like, partial [Clarias magur]